MDNIKNEELDTIDMVSITQRLSDILREEIELIKKMKLLWGW